HLFIDFASFSFPDTQPTSNLHSFPTRRSSDLKAQLWLRHDDSRHNREGRFHGPLFSPAILEVSNLLRAGIQILPVRFRIGRPESDRKSTRLNSSHVSISYAVFCLKKKRMRNLS